MIYIVRQKYKLGVSGVPLVAICGLTSATLRSTSSAFVPTSKPRADIHEKASTYGVETHLKGWSPYR